MSVLQARVEPETAGDPMSEQKWVRSSLRHLSEALRQAGHPVSPPTVERLLREAGYGLHGNTKTVETASCDPAERDRQFAYIAAQRQAFEAAAQPVISVDTKKKELIGNFKNSGQAWGRAPEPVNAHALAARCLGPSRPLRHL